MKRPPDLTLGFSFSIFTAQKKSIIIKLANATSSIGLSVAPRPSRQCLDPHRDRRTAHILSICGGELLGYKKVAAVWFGRGAPMRLCVFTCDRVSTEKQWLFQEDCEP